MVEMIGGGEMKNLEQCYKFVRLHLVLPCTAQLEACSLAVQLLNDEIIDVQHN
jgi:hypothetical protein